MIISLLGYMGSGKSHISKILAEKLNFEKIDLDLMISRRTKLSISEIFETKGEIFFRKQERELLEEILSQKSNCILSLGGGTPAYYNNMEVMNHNSVTVYLSAPIPVLVSRLIPQKEKRPLIKSISDDDLPEFIAKHLFERLPYYSRAQYTVNTAQKEPNAIADEIINLLG